MKHYDNGEPVTMSNMEDESWYGYFSALIDLSCTFDFIPIEDVSQIIDMFKDDWENIKVLPNFHEIHPHFPSPEQILRWSVLIKERNNRFISSPEHITALRVDYAFLKDSLSNWTDMDVAAFTLGFNLKKKSPHLEIYKDIDLNKGFVENKWIVCSKNKLSDFLYGLLNNLVKLDILEIHSEDAQIKWKDV